MKYDFDNKVAVVTGGTGGIGAAIVDKLINSGATVIAFGTSLEKLEKLKEKYKKDQIITVACNLGDREETVKKFTHAVEQAKKIDFLVSNAGITKDNLAIRMKDEEWDDVININLRATFSLNKEALKLMLRQKFGSIVNVTSVVGLSGNAGQANYAASKAGVIGMTKSLAQECASRGIRVNAVAPGFIETPMTDILSDAIKARVIDSVPMKSFGKPEDIANAVTFLLTDEAKYITGCTLHVNGGMAMF